MLINSDLDLSVPDYVFLQYFWLGLSKESTLFLHIASGGYSSHKNTTEGREILSVSLKTLLVSISRLS
jgi:hypothetical protein